MVRLRVKTIKFYCGWDVAKDIFHDAVRNGLQKEGWLITDDPFRIKIGDVEMYIDLGAEQVLAAERDGEKIAVEIKSFIGASNISEFHTAIGQCFNYRVALEEQEPERVLYLAVPSGIYHAFFKLQFIQTVIMTKFGYSMMVRKLVLLMN